MNALTQKIYDLLAADSAAISKAIQAKGYKWEDVFTDGGINMVAVRSANEQPNRFDDCMCLFYNKDGITWQLADCTTHPGAYYLLHPIAGTKGTGILVEGQYKNAFGIGSHTSHLQGGITDTYGCLTQITTLPVYRDAKKDGTLQYDPNTIEWGMFGIQIHRAWPSGVTSEVNNWSAACTVFASADDFELFFKVVSGFLPAVRPAITYTLLNEKDLITTPPA